MGWRAYTHYFSLFISSLLNQVVSLRLRDLGFTYMCMYACAVYVDESTVVKLIAHCEEAGEDGGNDPNLTRQSVSHEA